MDIKGKQITHCTYDETKIYTPRIYAQLKENEPPCVFLDHAPVRIYEKPVKTEARTDKNRVTF